MFTGTGKLFRLGLRCDRIKLAVWAFGLGVTLLASAWNVSEYYSSQQDLATYATVSAVSIPERAFNGVPLGISKGSVMLSETFSSFALFIAFMNTLLVIRHTRLDEEQGRSELLRGGAVGVFAPLGAAFLLALVANVIVGAFAVGGYLMSGLDLTGSILAGVAFGSTGMVFAAIGAIAAQIAQTARMANVIAGISIAVFFLIRAIGDILGKILPSGVEVESAWIVWLSPIGIARESKPFIQNNWWIAFVLIAIGLALAGVAFVLQKRRDLGSGLIAVRPGAPVAPRSLTGAFGLAWRQQRALLLGWAIGMTLLAIMLGSLGQEVQKITSSSEQMSALIAMFGGSNNLTKAYFAYCLFLYSVCVTGYAIQALQRTRQEEYGGRLELILSGSVRRNYWLLSHVFIVLVGCCIVLFLCGLATGITHGLIAADLGNQAAIYTGAALAYLPVVAIFAGLMALTFAALPKISIGITWFAFIVCYLITQLGDLFKLPKWAIDLSPYTHTPLAPSEDITFAPLAILASVAVSFIVLAIIFFKRRNLTTV